MATDRLQKVIANAGICSRRRAELMIQEGRVSVNGKPVTRPGAKVDASRDHVRVDGKRIRGPARRTYLLLNKPRGYLCTLSDPAGRPLVSQLIRGCPPGLSSVGRLDFNTEGLLLLTNDGEFANRVASAGPQCPKSYMAKVRGIPSRAILEKISKGLSLNGRKLAPCKVAVVKPGDNCWLRITLIEGRNNQIRKMFDRVGHSVIKLRRVRIGFLKDIRLKPGEYRHLSRLEVMRFLDSTADTPGKRETGRLGWDPGRRERSGFSSMASRKWHVCRHWPCLAPNARQVPACFIGNAVGYTGLSQPWDP